MVVGPATLVVMLVVGLLLVAGLYILISGQSRNGDERASERRRGPCICSACQHENSPGAKYCARCGNKLAR